MALLEEVPSRSFQTDGSVRVDRGRYPDLRFGPMEALRHSLPGDGGDSRWLERLNAFERRETVRQVRFKRKQWPSLPDGCWSKRPGYYYPHILPEGHLEKAFYPPVAKEVLGYCKANEIAVHTEALNLRSSQVCCFNVMFPLRQDLELAASALSPLLPDVSRVSAIEFEYTGPNEATEWLGEPPSWKRGQNRTSIDVAVWWEDGQGSKLLTLCEWKYTERCFGSCGGYESKGNTRKHLCRDLDLSRDDPEQLCYLTRISSRARLRRYWEHLHDAGISLKALSSSKGCPFMGAFYQLMRQCLLAAYLRRLEDVDEVFVASIGFKGNAPLHQVSQSQRRLGSTTLRAWNTCLAGVPPIRHVEVEDIVGKLRESPVCDTVWLTHLEERYGL